MECGDLSPHCADKSAQCETLPAVNHRATQTLQWVKQANIDIVSIALDHLALARTALYQALLELTDRNNAETEINIAVTYLLRAGRQDYLSHGLLTRAWLRVCFARRDASTAAHSLCEAIDDLNEAWEIAERGPMPLHMADIHLHRARLFGPGRRILGNPRKPT